jgi:hypothetical protein
VGIVNQALYVLNNDFFDKKTNIDYDTIAEKIESLTATERILLVYDPFCGDLFQKLANKQHEEELNDILIDYYGKLEKCKTHQLEWYQMNEYIDHHLGVINEIMISVDFLKYSISAVGCLPLTVAGKRLFLYYHLNPYFEVPNRLHLVSEKKYLTIANKVLEPA